MFVSVTASLALVQLYLAYTQYHKMDSQACVADAENPSPMLSDSSPIALPRSCHPNSAFFGFEFMFLLALSVLNFVAGMVASGAVWTVATLLIAVLHFYFYRWCTQLEDQRVLVWIDHPTASTFGRVLLSFFYVLWGIAFIAFPVFQSWDDPVAPFVRWFKFTESGELVWRGIFASYAISFLWCVFDPFNRHRMYIGFVACSGFIHASFMLAASLYSRAHGLPNGNSEHLFGDIAGWFVISLFSAAMLLGISLCAVTATSSSSLADSESNNRLTAPDSGSDSPARQCSQPQLQMASS
jgi:hypothetical protein